MTSGCCECLRETEMGIKDKKTEKMKVKQVNKQAPRASVLSQEIVRLIIKITSVIVFGFLILQFVYGFARYPDDSMTPAVKAGDVLLYYRLNKNYTSSDTVILEYEEKLQARRIVAIEGDTVDITEEGLIINDNLQVEAQIYEETLPDQKGIEYPVTLEAGQVFVLGDKRTAAVDSRIYGPVEVKNTLGKVITILRRRSI